MGRSPEQQQGESVVAAIERVLRTERDGVQQLRQAEDHAQHLLAEARAQAAAIARRTDACISKLHTAYLQKIHRAVQTLAQAETSPNGTAGAVYDQAVLADAAHRLAVKLTGGE